MAFPGNIYAPPGVYTRTRFENPTQGLLEGLRIPVFLGTGSELLSREGLEVVRGSSKQVDQQVVDEDLAGRAVVSVSTTGSVTLGDYDGSLRKVQVRHYPIVTGDGTGTTATRTSAVRATINGDPIVVLSIDGAQGILELSTPPKAGDEVRITYFFNRTDTLITDDLSDQVTDEAAVLRGAKAGPFEIEAGVNDTLLLSIDGNGSEVVVTFPDSGTGTWTASQLASYINTGVAGTSLVAGTYVNNFGETAILLSADRDIKIGAGTANSTLGFSNGTFTGRNRVFYTFNGPIVDGSNGGVTTTDPSDVTVKVDGVQVIPSAVDGASRAVTLPFAPENGASVSVTYYFNSWQDTFDYVEHRGLTQITRAGVTPERSDFIEGVDFVLQDDKILWGTAAVVRSGEHTQGTTLFGENQVTATLVDQRQYLAPCAPVTDTSVSPPTTSRKTYRLPLIPTSGNGRNSPLGSSLHQTVANDRIDLPTNRPDLVVAYWGYGVQDAIERGPVTVLRVDSDDSTLTLKDPVPVGADVYATFYYNTIQDAKYTLTVEQAGAAGVGTYSIQDAEGEALHTVLFGAKGAGLTGISVQFPSGSERLPQARFEAPFDSSYYVGPVEEDVTVTFRSKDSTLAKLAIDGSAPYYPISSASDKVRLTVDGSDLATGAAGLDLDNVMGVAGLGFHAHLLGEEVQYDAASGYTTYEIDATNNEINLTVDGVLLEAVAGATATGTVADFVTAINTAAAATPPNYHGTTRLTSAVTVTAGEYDEIVFHYTGDVSGGTGAVTATVAPGTYVSAGALATAIQAAVDAEIAGLGVGYAGLAVAVSANAEGQIVFALTKATADASGYLEFVTHATPAQDMSVLLGLDTAAAANGSQTKVVDGPIARRFTLVGDQTGALLHDRIILRNRLVPGAAHAVAQAGILVEGSTGATLAGLTVGASGEAAVGATVRSASLYGHVGLSGGQVASGTYTDERDGQPVVTFSAAGGTATPNNTFKLTVDGVPLTVTFRDAAGADIASGGSADVPLGPKASANTVLAQIQDALTAAGVSATAIQEGAGIRLISGTYSTASSILIGAGSANEVLGFAEGAVATRSGVSAEALASALMGHAAATISGSLNSWDSPSATYFSGEALAGVVTDDAGARHLYLQSQGSAGAGTTSSLAFAEPVMDSVLLPGVGLDASVGTGASGESGVSGFFVTSSDPSGSGSANLSVLNDGSGGSGVGAAGSGQDGVVGQTYRDLVTGLTFTVLEREGGSNYPGASTSDSFSLKVRKVVTTDSNSPICTLPGAEVIVTNTSGTGAGDTAIVETFKRSGNEPAIGDVYFVSYEYRKQSFETSLFTKFAAVEAAYGTLSPDNPVTLASYLAILNGAVLVGVKQVARDSVDGASASEEAFREAVDDLEGSLPGGVLPDVLVPMRGDSVDLFEYMAKHADIQSSLRYRAERTVIGGLAAGTLPRTAGTVAQAIKASRFRLVYPDIATLRLPRADGQDEETLVDGTFIAAALAGSTVSPNTDVATPWTNRRLVGFNRLARTLDAVEQNQVALNGVTVVEDRPPFLRVRQGLTTDMSQVAKRIPTVTLIVDETQRQSRQTLERFVGIKFLPGILSQIEGQLSNTLKMLVQASILSKYTGVKAEVAPDDPTVIEAEAFIAPVLPILYILLTFHLRSRL